jgi:hypothetical protein
MIKRAPCLVRGLSVQKLSGQGAANLSPAPCRLQGQRDALYTFSVAT